MVRVVSSVESLWKWTWLNFEVELEKKESGETGGWVGRRGGDEDRSGTGGGGGRVVDGRGGGGWNRRGGYGDGGEDVSTAAAGSEAMAGEDEGGTGGGAGRVVSVIVVAVDVKVGGGEVEVEGRNCRGGHVVAVEVVSVGSQAGVERKAEVEVVVRVWCLGLRKGSRQATAEAEAESEGEAAMGGDGQSSEHVRSYQLAILLLKRTQKNPSITHTQKNKHQRQTQEPTDTRTEHET